MILVFCTYSNDFIICSGLKTMGIALDKQLCDYFLTVNFPGNVDRALDFSPRKNFGIRGRISFDSLM